MLRILEISWLMLAVLASSAGIYKWLSEGFIYGLWFFICASIASIVWLVRRNQRRRSFPKAN